MQFKLMKKTRIQKRCFEIMTKSCILPLVAVSSYHGSTRFCSRNFHTISLLFESKQEWIGRWQPKYAIDCLPSGISTRKHSRFSNALRLRRGSISLQGTFGPRDELRLHAGGKLLNRHDNVAQTSKDFSKVLPELFRNRLRIVKNICDRF